MNPNLEKLQPYPFEKLNALLSTVTPNPELRPIKLSIGEPKHPASAAIKKLLVDEIDQIEIYPSTKGVLELRQTIAAWATQRFSLKPNSLDPETMVIPCSGTREGIFSFTQAAIDASKDPLVVSPNPFYQIYEGATYLAGAKLLLLPALEQNGFVPDFTKLDADTLELCQILFLCSPGNPTGAVVPKETLIELIELADKYDFILASDECYSEIYTDEQNPPLGLLQVCAEIGRDDYKRCVVFHSLSKRSNLPGMRSGFVAGDAALMTEYLKYRTYHGCALPIHHQRASIAAWQDEAHVKANREAYREKFKAVLEILKPVINVTQTDASFYLWPETPIDDVVFCKRLFEEQNVTVVPGSYLSRTVDGLNPGSQRVRMALVAPLEECIEAAQRIRKFLEGL